MNFGLNTVGGAGGDFEAAGLGRRRFLQEGLTAAAGPCFCRALRLARAAELNTNEANLSQEVLGVFHEKLSDVPASNLIVRRWRVSLRDPAIANRSGSISP
jgi:hypothetical protein